MCILQHTDLSKLWRSLHLVKLFRCIFCRAQACVRYKQVCVLYFFQLYILHHIPLCKLRRSFNPIVLFSGVFRSTHICVRNEVHCVLLSHLAWLDFSPWIFRRKNYRSRIFRCMNFLPYRVFTERSFRRQDFSPYRNFAVRSFRRTEFSPCRIFAVLLRLRGLWCFQASQN